MHDSNCSLQALPTASWECRHPPVELKRGECCGDPFGGKTGLRDQRIDRRRRAPQGLQQRAPGGIGDRGLRPGRRRRRLERQPQLVQNVLRRLDELRAVADQPMAAFGERRVDRAGQRKTAPLLAGEAGGDERAEDSVA
jgi:hypothetical protein